jgi:hypothetical protein
MTGVLRRLRPSPAMVVACTALLFALTGAGYAAGMLGPNTVGTKQLKNNAVVSTKIKNRSLLAVDFKTGQLPRGAKGDKGDPGAPGAPGAPGSQGLPGPFPDAFPAGKTLRGTYMTAGNNGPGNNHSAYSFGFRLPAAPIVHYIPVGSPVPADCPGTATNPQANPGHLCVFEVSAINATTRGICNPESNGCPAGSASRDGFAVFTGIQTAGQSMYVFGSWAVTAAATASPGMPHQLGVPTIR